MAFFESLDESLDESLEEPRALFPRIAIIPHAAAGACESQIQLFQGSDPVYQSMERAERLVSPMPAPEIYRKIVGGNMGL